jgi:hypothetical protein
LAKLSSNTPSTTGNSKQRQRRRAHLIRPALSSIEWVTLKRRKQ